MRFVFPSLILLAPSVSRAEPSRVTFEAIDGRSVVVSEIHAQMGAQTFTNFGATATTTGEVWSDLCMTDCTVELEPGFHKIRFGAFNPMSANVPVNLTLEPGQQTLRVRPFDGGKAVSGLLLGILGSSGLIVGGTLALIEPESRGPMAGLAVVGAGSAFGGILLVNGAKSRIEAVSGP